MLGDAVSFTELSVVPDLDGGLFIPALLSVVLVSLDVGFNSTKGSVFFLDAEKQTKK